MSPSWGRTMGEECSSWEESSAKNVLARGLKVEERGQGDKDPSLRFNHLSEVTGASPISKE